MALKVQDIAGKMKPTDEIRAKLQELQACTGTLDPRLPILNDVLQVIEIESKRGATDAEARLQGARKVKDMCIQLKGETLKYPKIGRDAYYALPLAEQWDRQRLLALSQTVLWIMGEE